MRIRNEGEPVAPGLLGRNELLHVRLMRNFEPHSLAHAKCWLLNEYMRRYRLSSCVVAVSGGIDSAVVLGLAALAASQEGSAIKRILPVLLPVSGTMGATNQELARSRGDEACRAFGIPPATIDLGGIHAMVTGLVQDRIRMSGSPWADGQVVSTLRTPILYYVTSLLLEHGLPALLLGTTNRDEGAYLGYFGKASDGMVDVQLISDLHKSEVRRLASWLGVAPSIMDAEPTGDMWDGGSDERLFGATYDMVELVQALAVRDATEGIWRCSATQALAMEMSSGHQAIERLHGHNAHKYLGRSPAIHLDIMEAWMPGGWDNRPDAGAVQGSMPSSAVAPFDLSEGSLTSLLATPTPLEGQEYGHGDGDGPCLASTGGMNQRFNDLDSLVIIDGFLSTTEVGEVLRALPHDGWAATGSNGRVSSHTGTEYSGRRTAWSPEVAARLWHGLRRFLPAVVLLSEKEAEEHAGWRAWRPVGVSPLLRFIRYGTEGSLVPHYDAPHVIDARRRTLMSLVVYLEGEPEGGTGFLHEHAHVRADVGGEWDDWKRMPDRHEVAVTVIQHPGTVACFPHRLLHFSPGSPVRKTILRTDVIFEMCCWRGMDGDSVAMSIVPPPAMLRP